MLIDFNTVINLSIIKKFKLDYNKKISFNDNNVEDGD